MRQRRGPLLAVGLFPPCSRRRDRGTAGTWIRRSLCAACFLNVRGQSQVPPPPPFVSGSALYVSNGTATTSGTGSWDDPFSSLQSCVDALTLEPPGSACLLLDGVYRLNATVRVRDVHGTLEEPKYISSAPGADVVFDGTLEVPGPWTWFPADRTLTNGTVIAGGHWVADWPEGYPEPWQVMLARARSA